MMTRAYGSPGDIHQVGGLLMLLTWVFVVAAVVWLLHALVASAPVSRYAAASRQMGEYEAALALLTRRYNAGVITAIEYEQARGALGRL
jgi:uncharacterized membrane protein